MLKTLFIISPPTTNLNLLFAKLDSAVKFCKHTAKENRMKRLFTLSVIFILTCPGCLAPTKGANNGGNGEGEDLEGSLEEILTHLCLRRLPMN